MRGGTLIIDSDNNTLSKLKKKASPESNHTFWLSRPKKGSANLISIDKLEK